MELGAPGPQDVPGASRARRNSPSPCPGTADVVDVADDVGDVELLEEGGVVLALVLEAVVVDAVPEGVDVPETLKRPGALRCSASWKWWRCSCRSPRAPGRRRPR